MLAYDTTYMKRCLQLANYGIGKTAPNPMVGAVIVHKSKIIGEGYHCRYGEAHAEPNAINSVENKSLLKDATLYVSLEPCSHQGKTPPCADLIIKHGISRVVVGSLDPNPQVAGRGIKRLQDANIKVVVGVMEEECRMLNKHFFMFFEQKRPYITLKWAQTADGFIDTLRENSSTKALSISTETTSMLVHKLRAENQAILVGTNTAILDNPSLNVRKWNGENPIRLVLDRLGRIPEKSNLFSDNQATIVYTEQSKEEKGKIKYKMLDFDSNLPKAILDDAYQRNINSILIEGGAKLLTSFIEQNLWDEARVETSPLKIGKGIKAPTLSQTPRGMKRYAENKVFTYKRE